MSLRVVIVGRPNVGKSTLFNRLIGHKRALVHNKPGVTRDRIEEPTEWYPLEAGNPMVSIRMVDTGGVAGDTFEQEVDRQVEMAAQSADVLIMVVDGQAGITPHDEDVFRRLSSSKKFKKGFKLPWILAVNKIDDRSHEEWINDFYSLGIDTVVGISAEHNRGIEDLKENVLGICSERVKAMAEQVRIGAQPKAEPEVDPETGKVKKVKKNRASDRKVELPAITIVGRPNVGKSTLLNALLGEERMITSPIAGTTVDQVDSIVVLDGTEFRVIDTAGIRKKARTEKGVEVLSVVQAKKALERADVAILVLDASQGVSDQDEKIAGLIEETGCGVILFMNKWDVHDKNPEFSRQIASDRIRDEMRFLYFAPILFGSALRQRGLKGIGKLVNEIIEGRKAEISTKELTEWMRIESEIQNPRSAKIYKAIQVSKKPPTFICQVNHPNRIHYSLSRHIVKAMRAKWGFMGLPVRIDFVKSQNVKRM